MVYARPILTKYSSEQTDLRVTYFYVKTISNFIEDKEINIPKWNTQGQWQHALKTCEKPRHREGE